MISQIRLQQFRNYSDEIFQFSQGVTVITGNNGIGKTNILEALYVTCLSKSFRDPDLHLTQYDKDWWKIQASIDDGIREVRYAEQTKITIINDKQYKRLPMQQTIPVVLFEPDHLMLVHGSPSMRRTYIDKQLSLYIPGYTTTIRRYERVLAQRNRLLKSPTTDKDQLFVWDVSLADLGSKIHSERTTLIHSWNETLSKLYGNISEDADDISVTYSSPSNMNYNQRLLTMLRENYDRDRLIGSTTSGPHRDDYEFYLNTKNMQFNASRGEIRTLLLALKIHESHHLEKIFARPAILLFDDVFSELDERRQKKLLSEYTNNQVVITTTHIKNSKKYTQISLS